MRGRLLALGVGGVVTTATALGGVGVVEARSFSAEAHRHVDGLVDAGLDQAALDAARLVDAQSRAVQAKVDSDLEVARHVVDAHGPVTLARESLDWQARNQYSGEVTSVRLPRMLIGGQWLGNNADPHVETPVVDEVADLIGGTVTLFRRMNDRGDLLRVATNVQDADGRRAVGTYIPARNPDGQPNPVVTALLAGQTYRGVAYVVDDWYVTAYEPIRDAAGNLVGALYVGVPQDNLDTLRDALSGTSIGGRGSVTALRATGPRQGAEIFAPANSPGTKEDTQRAEHTRQMAVAGVGLRAGEVASGRYLAVGADGRRTPMIYRVAYYAPWDYVIAVQAPEAEFTAVAKAVDAGQRAMIWALVLAGLAVSLVGGATTAAAARRMARLQAQLTHQAFHDALTGLANRTLFTARVEHALLRAHRTGTAVGVLFLDLDDFKTVNDTLGHDAGDHLLVEVADRLRADLRPADTPARLGGDEFAVLLEDLPDPDTAATAARRLLHALEAPFRLAGRDIRVRASVGVATGAGTAAQLLSAADAAMYTAKTSGKNRHKVFQPAMAAAAAERLQLGEDLQRAVERDEFLLHYQPTVDLQNGHLHGVEALIRWQHPQRGLLPPGKFIALAEENGLIVPIGEWVLRQACTQAAQWRRDHPDHDLAMTVNLSGLQVRHPECAAVVTAALTASGLDPAALTLEITETVLMDDDADHQLGALKQLGVKLAIDDFGTGYSSLSYLSRFPIDLLKLDKSFVDDVSDNDEHLVLVQGVIELGHALGLTTLAEGIETATQRAKLTEMRCQLGQGYHFSRPLPPSAVESLLRDGEPLGQSQPMATTRP